MIQRQATQRNHLVRLKLFDPAQVFSFDMLHQDGRGCQTGRATVALEPRFFNVLAHDSQFNRQPITTFRKLSLRDASDARSDLRGRGLRNDPAEIGPWLPSCISSIQSMRTEETGPWAAC